MRVPFRVNETPCFFPKALLARFAQYGRELMAQLSTPEYLRVSEAAVPPQYRVPNENPEPLFVQVDFGLAPDLGQVRHTDRLLTPAARQVLPNQPVASEPRPPGSGSDELGLEPKLIEIQGFPSLYAFQAALAQAYIDTQDLGELGHLLTSEDYPSLLRRHIVASHDPREVVLLEVDPDHQKTRPDFLLTEKLLGVRAVCITRIRKQGRRLYDGDVPVRRIYNRAIIDEITRRGVSIPFDWRDDLDVEWAGHPNHYFRISKFSLPYLQHPSVPPAFFLDELAEVPEDLANWVLKPLFSFAGLGVVIGPSRDEIATLRDSHQWILQRRVEFAPVIATPHGPTKVEIRIMFLAGEPVLTIVRTGRGKMMGVDHNKNMEWVGASAALYEP